MVLIEDFEFQLVSADGDDTGGTNTPFKEHTNDSKTYVEVEPDAEYFLSIRKVQVSSTVLCCGFKVDGKNLGYNTIFQPNAICSTQRLRGLYTRSDGTETWTALQFVKASFTTSKCDTHAGIGSSLAGMGKIEMEVFSQGVPVGKKKRKDFNSSLKTSSIDIAAASAAGVTMKKNLRSGEGKTTVASVGGVADYDKAYMTYAKGTHLYTITLYYCATPGLIAVGVLPKPPLWTYARMLHPAKTTTVDGKKKQAVVSIEEDDDQKDKKKVKRETSI